MPIAAVQHLSRLKRRCANEFSVPYPAFCASRYKKRLKNKSKCFPPGGPRGENWYPGGKLTYPGGAICFWAKTIYPRAGFKPRGPCLGRDRRGGSVLMHPWVGTKKTASGTWVPPCSTKQVSIETRPCATAQPVPDTSACRVVNERARTLPCRR